MMGDLIERLRYKYADILHREAADEVERLTETLEIEENAYDMLATQHDALQVRVEGLEDRVEELKVRLKLSNDYVDSLIAMLEAGRE